MVPLCQINFIKPQDNGAEKYLRTTYDIEDAGLHFPSYVKI
jgi:hypothetical protein